MSRPLLACACLLVLLATGTAHAGESSLAPYFAVPGATGADPLPLKSTRAEVRIAGVIAQVSLTQEYANEGKTPLEAVYVFPGGTHAAVSGLRFSIGDRTITARIEPRVKARAMYEAAKSNGQGAALLEQERPNVFRMNVANILPGDRVRVDLDYSELLAPTEGRYEFVLPGVVGPRYAGAKPGAKPDVPYLHEGVASGVAYSVSVELLAGLPIHTVQSPTHTVAPVYADGKKGMRLSFDDPAAGNRDFVLHYWLAGGAIETGLLVSQEKGEDGYFLMMVQPPERVAVADIPSREYVFVVDVSGSMNGFPLATAKTLMRNLLVSLRPTDEFDVVLFSGGSQVLSPKSLPATQANIAKGLEFVDSSHGGGGTELLAALRRALEIPSSSRSRTFVVVTDGFVNVEPEAFAFVRENLGEANVFAFGIGSSVNRFLIEGLARAGMGEPFVVLDPAEAAGKAEDFRRYISSPTLTSVRMRDDGFGATDIEPAAIPDLFASRPVLVFGRYRGSAPSGRLVVSGRTGREEWSREIRSSEARVVPGPALRMLWARHRIGALEDQTTDAKSGAVAKIEALGLAHSLLTSQTSFVAVDEVVRNGERTSTTVSQPLPLPAGVNDRAVGGHSLSIGGFGLRGRGTGSGGSHDLMRTMQSDGKGAAPSKSDASVAIGGEESVIVGSLDPEIISAVIKRHLAQIRSCYERELNKKPKLKGKLVVHFTIEADGTVSAARTKSSTMKDSAVESCVNDQFRKIRFPAPRGGGIVTVNYPLLFSPGG